MASEPVELKVVSDGTTNGTHLVHADGSPFAVAGAHVACHVKGGKGGGSAEVVIRLAAVPVEVTESVATPFELIGHGG